MAYSITYRKNNEQVDLKWIVPTGWGVQAIREAFKQQYPQAKILKLEAIL